LTFKGCVNGWAVANDNVPVPALGAAYGLVGAANAAISVQSEACHVLSSQNPSGSANAAAASQGTVPLNAVPTELRAGMINCFKDELVKEASALENRIAGPSASSPMLKAAAHLVVANLKAAIADATAKM
jgi:hypothetical protein